MSDMSQPAMSVLTGDAGYIWPTPDIAGYPAPGPVTSALACAIEGLNGHMIEGHLSLFDLKRAVLQLRMQTRRPLPLRFDQFRRLCLKDALIAMPPTSDQRDLATQAPPLPFTVEFKNAPAWEGLTLTHQETPEGLFLFEPLEQPGRVQRWFVPRSAYLHAQIGLPIGEALVQQHSVTPDQIQEVLAEQESMRNRKLGDMLVVRQIITSQELAAAVEHQAKMPMVRIGEALTALGFITDDQLQDALNVQRTDRSVPLGELLVRKGLVSRADLQTALARKMGYPLVDVLQFQADADAITRLPYAVAARLLAMPLMMRAGRMVIAVEDPSNRTAVDELEFAAQCKLVPVLARSGVLAGAIEAAYAKVGAIDGAPKQSAEAGTSVEFELDDASKLLASMEKDEQHETQSFDTETQLEQSDNTLVRLINSMILEAHSQGVSDIHIECPPGKEKVRVRFRRDGQLRPYMELPISYRNALMARLKIMCDLDISERRKPQDGKINFSKFVPGVKLELRVATIPTQNNLEDAVLRLLASSKPIPIENLGMSPINLERLTTAAKRPYGMLLCVGPTGSGKTTTLHSLLSSINTPERKIWTAEDPVEITQSGLRQVQVNPRIEWTFAKALRAFLRADPDVIMVGEIRDEETAHVSVEASLTGHLVLSTLHTNSAPETITRLLDMGMDPFNFADALLGILAQRLVRRLCSKCTTPSPATEEELQEMLQDYLHVMVDVENTPKPEDLMAQWHERFGDKADKKRPIKLYRPVGCDNCGKTGYRGRAGIHELMMVSRGLRRLVQTGGRVEELQKQALGDGMRTLRQDGIEKVLAGVTTIDEIRANS